MDTWALDLHLFDGAAAEGGTAAQGAGEGQPAAPQGGRNKNPLAGVQYGKQAEPDAQDAPATAPPEVDRGAAFEELIKGEYKDEFAKRTQKVIDARFKATKELEGRLGALQPMVDALASRYGVDPTDPAALQKALAEDDSYYQDEADRKGLTVEQLKRLKSIERENEQLRAVIEDRQRREGADRIYSKWQQESEACAQVYPGFDLKGECEGETGERFMGLLKNGIDVKTAFEVVHKDELLGGAIQYAVQTTQKRTVDNIRARGMRPSENGASGNAPARIVKKDPSAFTRKDREEIARRVSRGERIEL